MDAINLIEKIKGTGKAAEKKTALEAQQFICQGNDCDCRGCTDSG